MFPLTQPCRTCGITHNPGETCDQALARRASEFGPRTAAYEAGRKARRDGVSRVPRWNTAFDRRHWGLGWDDADEELKAAKDYEAAK